jgi:hypothetical protein
VRKVLGSHILLVHTCFTNRVGLVRQKLLDNGHISAITGRMMMGLLLLGKLLAFLECAIAAWLFVL